MNTNSTLQAPIQQTKSGSSLPWLLLGCLAIIFLCFCCVCSFLSLFFFAPSTVSSIIFNRTEQEQVDPLSQEEIDSLSQSFEQKLQNSQSGTVRLTDKELEAYISKNLQGQVTPVVNVENGRLNISLPISNVSSLFGTNLGFELGVLDQYLQNIAIDLSITSINNGTALYIEEISTGNAFIDGLIESTINDPQNQFDRTIPVSDALSGNVSGEIQSINFLNGEIVIELVN